MTNNDKIVKIANCHGFDAYTFNDKNVVVEIPWKNIQTGETGIEINIVGTIEDLFLLLGY